MQEGYGKRIEDVHSEIIQNNQLDVSLCIQSTMF